MILIADSGSTKVHWCLMAANGHTEEYRTDGINPLFQTRDAMRNSISNQLLPQIAEHLWAGTVDRVFFYGAGCTPEKAPFVKQAIESVFRKAEAFVASDMLGAARGLLGHEPGVACILGTGSNSCRYDGTQIVQNVPSLGFILGDEGSAATLGKRLVSDLLKNQLGDDLRQAFFTRFDITQADVIEHVYRQPFPNRWLAHLARFCAENIDDERIYRLVYDHFVQFIRRNVAQYFPTSAPAPANSTPASDAPSQSMPVSFAGSIAYYYRPVLERAMSDCGFSIGTILQDPLPGLIDYHRPDVRPTM